MRSFAFFIAATSTLAALGCNAVLGIDEHELAPGDASLVDTGPAPGVVDGAADSGTNANGTPMDADSDAGDGSTVDAGCVPACTGNTPVCFQHACVACVPGALSCDDKIPRSCDQNGTWKNGTPCDGATPICTNGVCGKYRLTGGLTSTISPSGTHAVKLVSGGFERGGRSCSPANVCVTGGISP